MPQLRALWKLVVVQTKLYLREPVAMFFTLLFAPLYLVIFGFISSSQPVAEVGGRGLLESYVPACAAIVIGVVGLMPVAIETSSRREAGVLRRFRATPLRPLTYMIGDVLVYLAMVILGILLLLALGRGAYQVRFHGNFLAFFAGILLSATAFLALGYVVASLVPNPRVATVVGNVLLFPMMVLSGAAVPIEVMPPTIQNISRFIPLTHVISLLRGLWFGESFGQHLTEVVVLSAMLLVGMAIVSWTFRWE